MNIAATCVIVIVYIAKCNSVFVFRQQKEQTEAENCKTEKEGGKRGGGGIKVNPALEEQLRRLQEERDGLLKTGVFNTEDDMILELERRIRAVIHSIDNSS